MAVEAMKAGKYAASEVPCALTMEQCWELVDAHEATGVPCMMLENWSFRRDNLALLKMIRQGLFGQMVHCHCSHSHNCVDHFYWGWKGERQWPGKYLENYNRDQYPTHSLGPVLSWMDIGCGDYFDYATATATASLGINAHFARLLGPDHPMATKQYPQGDIVTTVVKTHKGRTIVINNDMQLPRPYDNRWVIQGTLGVYHEERGCIYIHGKSPESHIYEPFGPYQDKYEHAWWKQTKDEASGIGHGGTDYLELREFLQAVRNRTQTPLDVYDSVLMSALIPLSEQSIAKGSAPVKCPDFTRGKWKTRKPTFAMET
jgi:predicted dehydrogenase